MLTRCSKFDVSFSLAWEEGKGREEEIIEHLQ